MTDIFKDFFGLQLHFTRIFYGNSSSIFVFHCLLSIFYILLDVLLQAAIRPPTFVFFVNDAKLFTETYRRYMGKQLRLDAGFSGTPIRLLWRSRRKMGKAEGQYLFCVLHISTVKRHSILLWFSYSKRRDIHKHEKTPRGERYARAWGSSTILEPTCPLPINLVSLSLILELKKKKKLLLLQK